MPSIRAALLVAALSLSALPALAADAPAAGGGADPMSTWSPPVLRHAEQDRKEIAAYLKSMETAAAKGDLDAAAALVDFPVLMVTDDRKGEAAGEPWSKEQWLAVMKPFYAKPMPPGSMVSGKPTIVLVTDSLAVVGSPWTMKMGKQKVTGTSALMLVRKGGAWKAKAFMEGGWGDMPMEGAAK